MHSRLTAIRILGRLALTLALAAPLYLAGYRPLQLRWGATDGELAQVLPGDEIAPQPIFNATRAITIDASPAAIWPWLVQIGYGRAGWYSALDWFDNAGVPSAERIVPALQHLAVGDPLPIWKGISQQVVAVEPQHSLLTASTRAEPDSWVWALVPLDAQHTRLVWRMRNAHYDWASPFVVAQLATDLGDFVFVRNIELGIKERVEGRPIGSLAAGTPEVALWLVVFAAFLGSLGALVLRRDWLRPLLAVGGTYALTLVLVFTMPPLWVDGLVVLGVCGGLWWIYRRGGQGGAVRSRRAAASAAPPLRQLRERSL
jgi:hypothetical protein